MNRIIIVLFLIFIPLLNWGKILVRVAVFDIQELREEFPDAKELKYKWELFLNKKYYWSQILEKELAVLVVNKKLLLSERGIIEIKKKTMKIKMKKLNQLMKKNLKKLQYKKGRDVKRKIFLAIKESKRKKGFGIVLSSKQKMIIFYDENLYFNPYVIEELVPPEIKNE